MKKLADLMEELADRRAETEKLRRALRDAHHLIWEARLFKGYYGGPLHTPFAEKVERAASIAKNCVRCTAIFTTENKREIVCRHCLLHG